VAVALDPRELARDPVEPHGEALLERIEPLAVEPCLDRGCEQARLRSSRRGGEHLEALGERHRQEQLVTDRAARHQKLGTRSSPRADPSLTACAATTGASGAGATPTTP